MNTTLAAAKARRTVATIRTWCRRGVVAATKTGGKWVIDQTSLEYRISLDKPAAPKPLTAEMFQAIGGRRWTKAGHDRVYINNWADFAGIEIGHYKTGNVAWFSIGGRQVANGRAGAVIGSIEKVWFDAADGKLYATHHGARALEIRFKDGERTTLDLLGMVFTGLKAAARATA
jgi:hypothetical protein